EITLPSNKEVNSTLRIYKNIKNINMDKDKINQAQILAKDINKDFTSLLDHLSKYKYSYNEICYLVFYKHILANIDI
ncbi:TPA: hypothetical protein ACF2EX_003568, partial [Acinetobacter baumannii]